MMVVKADVLSLFSKSSPDKGDMVEDIMNLSLSLTLLIGRIAFRLILYSGWIERGTF